MLAHTDGATVRFAMAHFGSDPALRRRMRAFVSVVFAVLGAAACGEAVEGAGSSPAESNRGASSSDAGASGDAVTTTKSDGGGRVTVDASTTATGHGGRCVTSKDCDGDPCVELVPGGFRVCSHPAAAPQTCTDGGESVWPDECCGSCPGAHSTCTLTVRCGGAYMAPHNVCVTDECQTAADCTGKNPICLPSGVRSDHRTCLADNECLHDSDCKAAPNGACVLPGSVGPAGTCNAFTCGSGIVDPVAGPLRCVYGASCTDDADCSGDHCEASGNTLRCVAGARAVCPPPP